MKNYLVSICVPVYGVEKYIERCAVSLFEQTYKNIEYIFVNDCTKDNSMVILNEVVKRYPNRQSQIHILNHEHNRGLAAARNTAVDAVHGEFLMHVDSDDYIDIKTVDLLVKEQMRTGASLLSFDVMQIKSKSKEVIRQPDFVNNRQMAKMLLSRQCLITVWGRFIETSIYRENSIRACEGYNMGEDYLVMPRLAYFAKAVCIFHKVLYFYNCINELSYCSNGSSKKSEKQVWAIYDMNEAFFANTSPDYLDALYMGKSDIAANSLAYSLLRSDKDAFNKIKRKILPLKYKLVIRIQNKKKILAIFPYYTFWKLILKILRFKSNK